MNATNPGTSRAAYAKGPEKIIPRTISPCLQALLSSEQQLWKEGKEEIQRRREQIPTSYHLRDRNSKKCVAERAFPQGASPFQGLWCGKLPHEPSTPSGWFHVHLEPVKLLLLLGWGIKPALQTASQCCREDLLEMRTPLVTLLAAVLCVQQVYPFMCYTCQEQESNKDCLTISMCAKEDKHCVTVRKDVGTKPNKPKYVISKMCSPTCPETGQQQPQSSQNVSCCEKPLCNVNGVSSRQSSHGMMSLGVLASITYIFTYGL